MKTVSLLTNNVVCEQHFYYIARLEKYLRKNGFELRRDFSPNGWIILCGCGFHESMFVKVVNTINHVKALGISDSKVIVLGCISKIYRSELEKMYRSHVVETKEESQLDAIMDMDIPLKNVRFENALQFPDDRRNSTFFIKILEGCLMKCTYCVIKKAMGFVKSVPKDEIIARFRTAISNGYSSIHFMGEDIFAYGVDSGIPLPEIIDEMLAISRNFKLDLGSFHAQWIIKYKEQILKYCSLGVITKMHISIQHIDKDILKNMGRGIDIHTLFEILRHVKRMSPDTILITDIITGFPGESRDKFKELCKFAKNDDIFDLILHHGYSDNPQASSSRLPQKVPSKEILRRWCGLNKILAGRSPYNEINDDHRDAITRLSRLTVQNDFIFCVNTYKELE